MSFYWCSRNAGKCLIHEFTLSLYSSEYGQLEPAGPPQDEETEIGLWRDFPCTFQADYYFLQSYCHSVQFVWTSFYARLPTLKEKKFHLPIRIPTRLEKDFRSVRESARAREGEFSSWYTTVESLVEDDDWKHNRRDACVQRISPFISPLPIAYM